MMHRFNIDRKPRIRSLPMAFGSGEPVFLLGKIVCFSILNGKNDEFICVRLINQSINQSSSVLFSFFPPTLLEITGRYFIRRIHEKQKTSYHKLPIPSKHHPRRVPHLPYQLHIASESRSKERIPSCADCGRLRTSKELDWGEKKNKKKELVRL